MFSNPPVTMVRWMQLNANNALRHIVRLVALLNLSYFGVEFAVALALAPFRCSPIASTLLEDASVNFLIFAALGRSAARRARVGMALAGILLVPAVHSGPPGTSSTCRCLPNRCR